MFKQMDETNFLVNIYGCFESIYFITIITDTNMTMTNKRNVNKLVPSAPS